MNNYHETQKINLFATLALTGTVIFWSIGPIFITYLTDYLDSWTQNFLRYLVACCFWLPFLFISIGQKKFDRRIWRKAILPATANLLMQSFYAGAFYYIGPAFMVLLAKTNIIWIAGFSLIFFPEERPLAKSKRFWLGLLLSATGVAGVMYFKEDFTTAKTMTGVFLSFAMAVMWAVYTLSVRIAFRDIDSSHGFSVISIYTVAGLFICTLLFGDVGDCVRLGLTQWVCIVISGILCIALGHVLYYAAMRRIGATIPALVILLQPFIVMAISHLRFGKSLNIQQIICGVVLLAGTALSIWAQEHLKNT
ncbi:MAG: DMT family transporter [Sedimentisphaerales bacterium]|nr:DMT family transporter [Sedimentisphaerales bacterium]